MAKIYFLARILLFLAFISASSFSQWVSRYNGPANGNDGAIAVTSDASGNIYVTGSSVGSSSNLDYLTIKYNSSGQEQWVARYNGPGNSIDMAHAIAVDAAGNVIVTGASTSLTSVTDYATVKYSSFGQEVWVARYNGPVNGTDEALSLDVDGSGNVFVTGQSLSQTGLDFATVKYSVSGQQLWASRYNSPENSTDFATVVRVDGSGNVFVTGSSKDHDTEMDYATLRYNALGQEMWLARLNGNGNADDVPSAMELDALGNIYVTGSGSGSGTSNDYLTVKYASNGFEIWKSTYNGTGNDNDIATGLGISSAGNVYVTGSSIGQGTATDYATVMYNSSGQQQWASRFDGVNSTSDDATSLVVDASGFVYVTGASNSGGTNTDYLTVRYNTSGGQVFMQRYNGPGNGIDAALSICLDNSGNVCVTGNSVGSGSSSDFATVVYSTPTAIEPVSSEIPAQFRLHTNYPNPFNPATKINFDLPSQSFTKIVVYDLTGKTVHTLVNEDLGPGKYSINFNAAGLASGVYFYKITAGDFNDVRKMMLVK